MKLTLKKREITGKKVKNLRRNAEVPGSIYGPTRQPLNISADVKELRKAYKEVGYSKLLDVEVEGEKEVHKAVIKEVQIHPYKENYQSVSLYQVDMNKPISAVIPVTIIGMSPAVKMNLGILVSPVDTLTVKCLPGKLPSEIVIDASKLDKVGMMIHPKDIELPEGVEFVSSVSNSMVIAYIAPPQKKVETVESTEEGAEEGEGAETEESEEE